MRDAKDVVPYNVVAILFVGEDSILPLKLDVVSIREADSLPLQCGY